MGKFIPQSVNHTNCDDILRKSALRGDWPMRYLYVVLGIFFGDGAIKRYIVNKKEVGESRDILKGRLTITRHHNKGVALNFMEEKPELVKGFTCGIFGAAAAGLVWALSLKKNHLLKTGMSMLIGGGMSNLYDRMKRGYVVDYFTINAGRLKNIIFNLSDFMILFGSILALAGELLREAGASAKEKK